MAYSGLAPGSYTITAVYGGDANDQGSTGTSAAQLVVAKLATTTDLTSSTHDGSEFATGTGGGCSFGSGSVPTGTVTFNDGSNRVGDGSTGSKRSCDTDSKPGQWQPQHRCRL